MESDEFAYLEKGDLRLIGLLCQKATHGKAVSALLRERATG